MNSPVPLYLNLDIISNQKFMHMVKGKQVSDIAKEPKYCKGCNDDFYNKTDCKSIKKYQLCVYCRKMRLAREMR